MSSSCLINDNNKLTLFVSLFFNSVIFQYLNGKVRLPKMLKKYRCFIHETDPE